MRLLNKARYAISFLSSILIIIYLLSVVFGNIQLTPFIVLGLISILAIMLPDKYQHITLFLIYAPATYSLYELVVNDDFYILIELTTGYLLSLPVLFVYGYYKSNTPTSIYSNYIGSCFASLLTLNAVLNSDGTAISIFYNYLFGVIKRAALSSEVINQFSLPFLAPLSAISGLAFCYYLFLRGMTYPIKFNEKALVTSLVMSISFVGIIVFYSMFFVDSIALGLILSSISLVAISAYTRVAK